METSNVRALLPWTRRNSNRKWDRTITKNAFSHSNRENSRARKEIVAKANEIESSGLNFIVHVLFVANTSSPTDSGDNYLIGKRLFMQSRR